MEQTNLITEALNLTLFGMGFVFLFLAILVFAIKLMSTIIEKTNGRASADKSENSVKKIMADEMDEETKFAIEKAIKMHRGA
ncbi:OadG family protein [Bathymodiolus septemdierum thioautotrophic gill symbiont]|uniref:Oxaloacetate decarboxylase gamma chain n=1 Tax=endosymbiont of Bathymodiolus septemdierum str. Myojin knoll TaxID=1303921 RepID=A0A0P0USY3_9GAMM|nr:OadG family protein [Bathymodiolus septemdierum thioautotrophic gill symbiont]BAS68224.1 oxaloacetate decarboxylase, gamma subunit [endosymbiont of Bathymodiolus septemdierum str. Myojin knoll]